MSGPITKSETVVSAGSRPAVFRDRAVLDKKLDPVQDRVAIVKLHAEDATRFRQEEADAAMLGTVSAYATWWKSGKQGPNPIFRLPVETVVAAISSLTAAEVSELSHQLSATIVNYPRDYTAAHDAAKKRWAEVAGTRG